MFSVIKMLNQVIKSVIGLDAVFIWAGCADAGFVPASCRLCLVSCRTNKYPTVLNRSHIRVHSGMIWPTKDWLYLALKPITPRGLSPTPDRTHSACSSIILNPPRVVHVASLQNDWGGIFRACLKDHTWTEYVDRDQTVTRLTTSMPDRRETDSKPTSPRLPPNCPRWVGLGSGWHQSCGLTAL